MSRRGSPRADEFYGGDRGLRRDLQGRSVDYVLAVAKSHRISLPIGVLRADQAAARLHRRCWNRLSAGKGDNGDRDHGWAPLRIIPPADEEAGQHWLLVRRRISDDELAYYRCWSLSPRIWPDYARSAQSGSDVHCGDYCPVRLVRDCAAARGSGSSGRRG